MPRPQESGSAQGYVSFVRGYNVEAYRFYEEEEVKVWCWQDGRWGHVGLYRLIWVDGA